MKKRIVSALFLFLALTFVTVCAQDASHEIVKRDYPFYVGSTDNSFSEPFPLYFIDGVDDLPYVELESWMNTVVELQRNYVMDKDYDLVFNASGKDAAYIRENEYHMHFDFEKDTIFFDDYNAFSHSSEEGTLLDTLSLGYTDELGESALFQRDLDASFDRWGNEILLNLSDYNINLIMQDGKYYAPLQTMNDLMIAQTMLNSILFNGENLIMATRDQLGTVRNGLTDLGELYYSAPTGKRSPELAEFGYNELCFVLDNLYGLKAPHDIQSFHQFFWQMGFDEEFKTADAENADNLLFKFIDIYLDDLHSEFTEYSYLAGEKVVEWGSGPATTKLEDSYLTYSKARAAYYEDGYFNQFGDNGPFLYEEVGNTAYITFDKFISGGPSDYYDDPSHLPSDTIGLIIYAHNRIYREDSPIENVVIDLSNNTGGSVDAAIFVMSWYLGEANISIKNTFTGALSTAAYRADVNLDHKFNNGDVVDDKNLFVVVSPVSFSCGNLVPAAFKASDKVTVLGRTSGGGSCLVQPLSTAWGTSFQISGPSRLSFLKNGSFYDIDTGVAPDYTISQPSRFYDHEALTDYINNHLF